MCVCLLLLCFGDYSFYSIKTYNPDKIKIQNTKIIKKGLIYVEWNFGVKFLMR